MLISAALLAGCGGGGSGNGSTGSSSSAPTTEPEQQSPAAIEKLRHDSERVEAERKQEEGQAAQSQAESHSDGQDAGGGEAKPPPPAAKVAHHDSGGGAAQFGTKGGDNSIQEFGEEASDSERESAAAVLHAYLDSRAAHRWDDACFYMSSALVASVEQFAGSYGKERELEGCGETLAALSEGSSQKALEELANVDVGSLRGNGERGFLLYYGPGNATFAMPVVVEDGAWKVASLDATPLS